MLGIWDRGYERDESGYLDSSQIVAVRMGIESFGKGNGKGRIRVRFDEKLRTLKGGELSDTRAASAAQRPTCETRNLQVFRP